ncbi:MAG: glycosyltransferase family 1 protein [Polyangiales bacterium]
MILGIDASNLRAGGGVTHLRELLAAADPARHGFSEVVVWAGGATARQLSPRDWLRVVHEPLLDGPLPARVFWQQVVLRRRAEERCDLLFVPGASAPIPFRPRVVMSRNMLPFDGAERRRYGASWTHMRLLALRQVHARSFAKADGVIFLTEYALRSILPTLNGSMPGQVSIIPHGIDARFQAPPRAPRPLADCSEHAPLRIVYVSVVAPYKHQWVVAEAVASLRAAGLPLHIEFVGGCEDHTSTARLTDAVRRLDPDGRFTTIKGAVPFGEMHRSYQRAELFVFASSCENMPNILLEAMAAGLPIACSERGPMPEVLGDGGEYFDPEDVSDTARAIAALATDAGLRARRASRAFELASQYSWTRCAEETLAFLFDVAHGRRSERAVFTDEIRRGA